MYDDLIHIQVLARAAQDLRLVPRVCLRFQQVRVFTKVGLRVITLDPYPLFSA